MWLETALKILELSLSIWDNKEKSKYQEKYISLKKQWYEEYNKTDDIRSDAALDNIEFELRLLADSFIYSASNKKEK